MCRTASCLLSEGLILDPTSTRSLLSPYPHLTADHKSEPFPNSNSNPLLLLPSTHVCASQLNMQAAFLISAKGFGEKQVGILFFCFGISQFFCMAPAGYFLDYSNNKIDWVLIAGVAASILTVITAITAEENGANMGLMMLLKILQGGITAILPPGFNGITLGIVGSTGFTHQVSRNRMMNHVGTALIVAFGSLLAYFLYPNIGSLFIVSPIAAIGMAYNLRRIKPTHVNRDAARGLIIESPTMNEYERYDEQQDEAAVAVAALSWQRMDDEDYADLSDSTREQHQTEILNQLSNLTTPSVSFNDGANVSSIRVDNSHNNMNTVPAIDAERVISPVLSATSSSYMPPDVFNSSVAKQTSVLLTSPVHESFYDGFQIPMPVTENTNNQNTPPYTNKNTTINYNASCQPQRKDSGAPCVSDGSSKETGGSKKSCDSGPSFNMGYGAGCSPCKPQSEPSPNPNLADFNLQGSVNQTWGKNAPYNPGPLRRARTPFAVLMDPTLMMFTAIIFFFNLANSSVLPLVMQSLALEDPQSGILLSGLCILIAQAVMSYFAKICGDYSPLWGRKNLMLVGLASLTIRCFLLSGLVYSEEVFEEYDGGSHLLKALILSTQLLDAVGAGILGCLHILVTNDISGGTGRFSLMLGVTTAAMVLGGTVSGYIGQAIAQDYGYTFAFTALGVISLVPLFLYIFFMPETLPDYARPDQQTFKKRRKRLAALLKKISEHKQKFVATANPFSRQNGSETANVNAKMWPLYSSKLFETISDSSKNASTCPSAANVKLV